jgi:hypothetical protein
MYIVPEWRPASFDITHGRKSSSPGLIRRPETGFLMRIGAPPEQAGRQGETK